MAGLRPLLGSVAFNIVMYGAGAVLSLYARAIKLVAPQKVLAVGQLWARISLAALRVFCGIRIELEGQALLPINQAGLIAAQHQSAFDTLVWLTLLPKPAYVLKQELLKLPLIGKLLLVSGFIAVDRAGKAASLRQLVSDCRVAVAAGRQIVIFPEGTRVPPGARAALQPGVVALAKALDLQVVPVATNSGRFWGRAAFHKHPGTLRIKVFAPLDSTQNRAEMLGQLAACFYDKGVDNSVD